MQLDSHRRQLSYPINTISEPTPTYTYTSTSETSATTTATNNMPCPRASRCAPKLTYTAEDGTEMQTWYSIRRDNVRSMRKMVKRVVLYMALIEAIRIAPDAIVFAGQKGYPERGVDDFGIAYCTAYVLSWLYLCVFSIVWRPLFSWWVPSSTAEKGDKSTMDKFTSFLIQANMVLLPVSIAMSLGEYVYHAVMTFIYVDARPVDNYTMPKNTQKNWMTRLMLLVGVFVSTTFGYGIFQILAEVDLAHVKQLEYLIIVVPVQINMGIMIGSILQWRMEMRMKRKQMALKTLEAGNIDEKEALLA